MCLHDECTIIKIDGSATVEETIRYCERADRRNQKMCSRIKKTKTVYNTRVPSTISRDDASSPASNGPFTPPTTGSAGYRTETRRPLKMRRLSISESAIRPEIVLKIGSKNTRLSLPAAKSPTLSTHEWTLKPEAMTSVNIAEEDKLVNSFQGGPPPDELVPKLEKFLLKDEQVQKEAAFTAQRNAENTERNAKIAEQVAEKKAQGRDSAEWLEATKQARLLLEAAKAREEAEAKVAAEEETAKLKPPIRFKDAVGRRFSFPWHLCRKWKGMEKLIKQAFLYNDDIGSHVQEGHYDLVGPDGEVILPQVWETTVQPDWTITMHMWPIPKPPPPMHKIYGIIPQSKRTAAKGKQREFSDVPFIQAAFSPPPPPAGVINVTPSASKPQPRPVPSGFARWLMARNISKQEEHDYSDEPDSDGEPMNSVYKQHNDSHEPDSSGKSMTSGYEQHNDSHEPDSDGESMNSGYAASVFSIQSLASSATDLARDTDYSANQIATATKELIKIFQNDDLLKSLYEHALYDDSIGPERLERNLRRFFKQCANLLKEEAKDRLEYLSAQLVAIKARDLSRLIVESFNDDNIPSIPELVDAKEDSSEDEEEDQFGEDAIFEDLVTFREFIVGSEAFRTLRVQIQSFVLPKDDEVVGIEQKRLLKNHEAEIHKVREEEVEHTERLGSLDRLLDLHLSDETTAVIEAKSREFQKIMTRGNILSSMGNIGPNFYYRLQQLRYQMNAFLVATGYLEPPLELGKARLRWHCRCGESFTGDFIEYKEGGIQEMVTRLQKTTRTKVTVNTHSLTNSNQKLTSGKIGAWLHNLPTTLIAQFKKQSKQSPLPQYSASPATTSSSVPSATPPQKNTLLLLSCIHAGRFRKLLAQDDIEPVKSDPSLFYFLRRSYSNYRGRFSLLFSLKTVRGIYFTKFRLPAGGSVEVYPHDSHCVSSQSCECIPPKDRTKAPGSEYCFSPIEPKVSPPIEPGYFAHLFTSPSCNDDGDTWILEQLPKRICGELYGARGQPVEGWGIYFKEDWDRDTITMVVAVLFLICSAVFGILWSCLKMDVQGAFGVSGYLMAVCVVILSLVTAKVDKA